MYACVDNRQSKSIAEERVPAHGAEPDFFADHRQKPRCSDDGETQRRDGVRVFVEEGHADRHGPEDLRIMRGRNLACRRNAGGDQKGDLSRRRAKADEGEGQKLVQVGHDEIGNGSDPIES